MDLPNKAPCPKCQGFITKSVTRYSCSICSEHFTLDYVTGYLDGKATGLSQSNSTIETLKGQIGREKAVSESRKRKIVTLSEKVGEPVKIARLSAADVKRIISEDCKRTGVDLKNAPAPKDIEDSYLVWTGAKIRKDTSGPQAKYRITGYTGYDVQDIILWLHKHD